MYIRWKKHARKRVGLYELGGELMVAYATESKRVNGQPRQTTTYLGSIRAGDCIDKFDGCLSQALSEFGGEAEESESLRKTMMIHHAIRRLLFWRAVGKALADVSGDHGALKAAIAKTVAPLTKKEASLVLQYTDGWSSTWATTIEEVLPQT